MAKQKEINDAINNMRSALLNIAELEEGILQKIKDQLDKMLDNIYKQIKEYKKIAALDAMVSETPVTETDPALMTGLASISDQLNEKNVEIMRLMRLLENLGLGVSAGSTQSASILRQQLDELTKRNRLLREVHQSLTATLIRTGEIPKGINKKGLNAGITLQEAKAILEKIHKEIHRLNNANYELRKQIKPQQAADNKDTPTPPINPTMGRRR